MTHPFLRFKRASFGDYNKTATLIKKKHLDMFFAVGLARKRTCTGFAIHSLATKFPLSGKQKLPYTPNFSQSDVEGVKSVGAVF